MNEVLLCTLCSAIGTGTTGVLTVYVVSYIIM